MPHDVNGKLVRPGQEVIVRFTVKEVYGESGACNVSLESVLRMPEGNCPTSIAAINTRQIEIVKDLIDIPSALPQE